jgi:glyoxylase-like metal-dependent hydrolase (beta-lactamase superfamily II)
MWVRVQTHTRGKIQAGLLILGLGGLVLCSSSPRVPEDAPPWFDLEEVRAIAGGTGLPDRVDAIEVVASMAPRFFLTGSLSLERVRTPGIVYRVAWPSRSGVVDGANDAEHQITPWATFDPEGWARSQAAMREAAWILVTHEHEDHLSGILTSPSFEEISGRVRLTPAQMASRWARGAGLTDDRRSRLTPWVCDGPTRLDAGVVVIPAAGHTAGSQMIYVRLSDGTEVLLAGDVVWNRENLERGWMKPRWVSWLMGEDIGAIARQIATLRALESEEGVIVIVAHDEPQHQRLWSSGVLGRL